MFCWHVPMYVFEATPPLTELQEHACDERYLDDLLRDFLTESAENPGKLDNDIVALEQGPGDGALLNGVFRTIHTIKGTCGFLDLSRLEGVAHTAENVLDALRAGKLDVRSELIGDVLAAVDCIQAILEHPEQTEVEPVGDDWD